MHENVRLQLKGHLDLTQCTYSQHSDNGFSMQNLNTLATGALERLPSPFYIVSIPEYRFVYANDATLNILKDVGVEDPLRIFGEHPWDVLPGWKEAFLSIYEDVCLSQDVKYLASHKYVGEHSVSYWDVVLIPNIDEETEEVTSISAISTDVTERVKTAELNRVLEDMNSAITSNLNIDSIMCRVVEEGTKAINAESGELSVREGTKLNARYVYGDFPDLVDAHFCKDEFPLSTLALVTGHPVVVNDALTDERIDAGLVEKFHLRSLIILPLITRNQVLGVLSFHHHSTAVPFTQPEIDFAARLATSASLALENARLFKDLRDELDQRKLAQNDLQRYQLFFQSSRDGMFMARLDGSAIVANDVISDMYEYSYDEIISLNIRDLRSPECKDAVQEQIAEAIQKKGILYETTAQRKDRSTFPVEVSARVAEIGGESVIIGVVRDVTERKRVEEELSQSERQFRSIFDNVSEAIIVYDMEHRIIDVNRIAAEMSGYTREELIGMKSSDLDPSVPMSVIDEHSKEAQEKGSALFEAVTFRRDGSSFPVEVNVRLIDYDGRPAELAVARDITERRQGEDALRLSEERFRAIFDGAAIGIALADVDRRIFASNSAYQKLLGYTQDELAGMSFGNYTYSEDFDRDRYLFAELMAGKRNFYQIEKRYVRKNGEIIWGRLTASIVKTPSGEVQFIIGMTEDISDRVRAVEELDAERQRLRTVLDVLPVGVFIASADGGIMEINNAVTTVWGESVPLPERTEAYGIYKGWWADDGRMLDAEDWSLARALKGEVSNGEIVDIQRFDGKRGTIISSAVPMRDLEGNIVGAVAVVQDITALRELERQATDLAARESEARSTLQAILDTAPTGIMVAQANGSFSYFSHGVVDIHGGPVRGTVAGPEPGAEQLLCRDKTPFPLDELPLMRSLTNGEYLRNIEMIVRSVDGNEVSVLVNSAPIKDENGQVIAAVATMTDITEIVRLRRELEDTLEREEHFSHMLQHALLPTIPVAIEGYNVASLYIPAYISREIGGDFFDLFETREGNIGILIGDVSGKGLEAAAFAATSRSTIHAFAYEMLSPADALTHANKVLASTQETFGLFVTVFLGIVDRTTGKVRYSSAGHPPSAIYRSDRSVEFLDFGDPPMGVFPGYQFCESECSVHVGEKIVLYTDGISEARQDFEFFGTEGVKTVLEDYGYCSPEQLISRLIEAATDWAQGKLRDDTAVLVIERSPRDDSEELRDLQLILSID